MGLKKENILVVIFVSYLSLGLGPQTFLIAHSFLDLDSSTLAIYMGDNLRLASLETRFCREDVLGARVMIKFIYFCFAIRVETSVYWQCAFFVIKLFYRTMFKYYILFFIQSWDQAYFISSESF